MKYIERYTQEELNVLFDAAHSIRKTMQKYDTWQNLVGYSYIYRECYNTEIAVMNEERRRLLEHKFNSEENESLSNH